MFPVRKVHTLILTLVPFIFIAVVFLSITELCEGVTELCNPNKSRSVYQFTVEQCPFGVLFAIPIKAECLKSSADNDQANFYADLCDNMKYEPDVSKQIQLISALTDGALSEKDSCKGTEPNQCDVDIKVVEKDSITEPGDDTTMSEEVNYDEPEEVTQRRNDSIVLDQTFRLMKFLAGLEGENTYIDRKKRDLSANESDTDADSETLTPKEITFVNEGPQLRITELLKLSFQVLSKHCDSGYVSTKFNREVHRAFMFLLRETDSSQVEDVTEQEHARIKKALDDCLAKDRAFALNGTACKVYSKVKQIEKNGETLMYRGDEFAYNPHLYDVPIDATWGMADFVHGLCYGTFKEHINSHHLYQRAIERLFGDSLIHRWNRPPVLHRPELWDHLLSANVRLTMKNLDVCIHAAYYDTPFMHRLERPLVHFVSSAAQAPTNVLQNNNVQQIPPNNNVQQIPPNNNGQQIPPNNNGQQIPPNNNGQQIPPNNNGQQIPPNNNGQQLSPVAPGKRRRRRRSASAVNLDDIGLSESGWCFQEENDQRNIVRAYIEANCPESPAIEQFQEIPPSTTPGPSTTEDPEHPDQEEEEEEEDEEDPDKTPSQENQ